MNRHQLTLAIKKLGALAAVASAAERSLPARFPGPATRPVPTTAAQERVSGGAPSHAKG